MTPRGKVKATPQEPAARTEAAMPYRLLAETYRRLEQTAARLEIIEILAGLFRQTPPDLLPRVVYLCQGKIAPDFAGVEIGLAEKLAARAVADATGTAVTRVAEELRRQGDLGTVAEGLLGRRRGAPQALTVDEVFDRLQAAAQAAGKGAQGQKIAILADLLRRAAPLEARYLVRTVTGKLRLGVGDASILDALAEVHAGGRAKRPVLERAYNICSDLGLVAETLVRGGLAAVEGMEVRPGHPVRPMLAQRLATAEEILAKLGGRCAVEYKYDGERVQVHRLAGTFQLYSRRLENITAQFPDVVALLERGLRPRRAILEAEIVAVEPDTGELRPFQDLMQRRRKYGIAEAMARIPAGLFAFDLLYADGEDLTRRPYPERREALVRAVATSERLQLVTWTLVDSAEALERFFEQAVADGCEGVICKAVGPEAVYQAGARGWLWIKHKREYRTALQDTLDLVVVGAFYGRGRRSGTYGALLVAAYDPEEERFPTFCKVGSGFSDADLAALPARLRRYERRDRPPRVDSRLEADVWFEPAVVIEVVGAEITLSPIHTVAWGRAREGAGLALRFPRFTGRWREDKRPEDATTVEEIWQLYQRARRRAVKVEG
ncbi:MAG: ATP-dependent DNA ligase [Armatimonadota bacterium]|nr:ATP-dependent DNA ligase [Armatimonadota bacterium]MDR7478532.1 ATP-dependent DNA ligase [Armatimonadota bacterium]MDR7487703.1 ATP-dependent DNA ligase [Armatimonadota bacterium]MDR7492040.1 ATP-dependent DNA ligase [Armatimonadota bacterium]MDR7500762.1 ATP-dependent DNA ligase [Armatimonadota bacterium]